MQTVGALLDTSVLYPAALRDTLLHGAAANLLRALWSREILLERERNLVEQRRVDEGRARRLVQTIERYFPESIVTAYESLVPRMTNDPKDRHVLAAAVASGDPVLVTTNLRHFPEPSLAPYAIEAQSPDGFLVQMLDRYPDVMREIIRDQAGDLINPPRTARDVLAMLALQAPSFAARFGTLDDTPAV